MILTLLRMAAPYLIAGFVGFGMAWQIQGLRLTAAKQEFTEYRQGQIRILQEAKDHADKQREQSAVAYSAAQKELQAAIARGDIYRRCVDSGKCGGLRPSANSAGNGLSPAGGLNATGSDAIPSAGTGSTPGVIFDCAYTTLQLNHLQADIERQPNYK